MGQDRSQRMNTIHVVKVEDHEYEGTCGACGKQGVRWIVTLSDGSTVGGECAKRILGWAPTKASHGWVTGMIPVQEATSFGDHWVLWQAKKGYKSVISRNGYAQAVGGTNAMLREWPRYIA